MQLAQTEAERDEVSDQLTQLKDFIAHVYNILGRVTGEEGSHTGVESETNNSQKSELSNMNFEAKLEHRAEEIVDIVEQI